MADAAIVNIAAADGHPVEIMDMSFAVQALSLEWLAKNYKGLEKKVYDIPAEIDDQIGRVKLAAMGYAIDTLTEEQIAEICQGTPNDWALVNAEQMREIYTLLPVHSEITEISEQNHARMEEIVRQQALRGGYRLAKILNEIFSK